MKVLFPLLCEQKDDTICRLKVYITVDSNATRGTLQIQKKGKQHHFLRLFAAPGWWTLRPSFQKDASWGHQGHATSRAESARPEEPDSRPIKRFPPRWGLIRVEVRGGHSSTNLLLMHLTPTAVELPIRWWTRNVTSWVFGMISITNKVVKESSQTLTSLPAEQWNQGCIWTAGQIKHSELTRFIRNLYGRRQNPFEQRKKKKSFLKYIKRDGILTRTPFSIQTTTLKVRQGSKLINWQRPTSPAVYTTFNQLYFLSDRRQQRPDHTERTSQKHWVVQAQRRACERSKGPQWIQLKGDCQVLLQKSRSVKHSIGSASSSDWAYGTKHPHSFLYWCPPWKWTNLHSQWNETISALRKKQKQKAVYPYHDERLNGRGGRKRPYGSDGTS